MSSAQQSNTGLIIGLIVFGILVAIVIYYYSQPTAVPVLTPNPQVVTTPVLVTPVSKHLTVKDGETLSLQCDTGKTIASVVNAKYNSNISTCGKYVTLPDAVGKNSYTLGPWLPTQITPVGDPCPNEPKTLELEYTCM